MADINIGAITEALNNKVDLPTNPERAQDQIDYVVDFQIPTEANGYTWYRKYKSGWVEQGGLLVGTTTSVTLPITMADTNYLITPAWNGGKSGNFYASDQGIYNITVAGFSTNGPNNSNVHQRSWLVQGMAA